MHQVPRGVEIVITGTAIEVVDASTQVQESSVHCLTTTKDIIKSVPIMEVSFTALDPKDKKMFSYITNDSRLGLMYCHAFSVKNRVGDQY